MTSTSDNPRATGTDIWPRSARGGIALLGAVNRRWTSRCIVTLSSALLFASGPASGQTSDPAAARALFNEGRKLTSQGHYDQACPKFEESMRLDNGIGTRFNLADCWEHIGRTASAWSLFLDVAASAKTSSQADREKLARLRAAALEPRLARLIIRVQDSDSGIEVRKNEVLVGRAQWGTATPLDPGSYVIEARAAGKKSWKTTVTIGENAPPMTVVVPELEKDATPAPVPAAKAAASDAKGSLTAPAASTTQGGMDPDAGRSSNGLRTVGWVVGAAGVVGVGVGAVFAAMTKSTDDKVAGLCTGGPAGNQCANEVERVEFDRSTAVAKNRATVSYVGFIAGGAALVTGTILVLTSGSSNAAANQGSRRTVVTPLIGAGTLGVGLSGAW